MVLTFAEPSKLRICRSLLLLPPRTYLNERCTICWNKWKINFLFFLVTIDFVHNSPVFFYRRNMVKNKVSEDAQCSKMDFCVQKFLLYDLVFEIWLILYLRFIVNWSETWPNFCEPDSDTNRDFCEPDSDANQWSLGPQA